MWPLNMTFKEAKTKDEAAFLKWLNSVAKQYSYFHVFFQRPKKGVTNCIFGYKNRASTIFINPDDPKIQQAYILFHEIAHKKLKHLTKKAQMLQKTAFYPMAKIITQNPSEPAYKTISTKFKAMAYILAKEIDADKWAAEQIKKRKDLFSQKEQKMMVLKLHNRMLPWIKEFDRDITNYFKKLTEVNTK